MAKQIYKEKSDHELLICIDQIVTQLKKDFENHLQHHFKYNILAWTVTLGALVTLALALIK